jgi:hypothetical protein
VATDGHFLWPLTGGLGLGPDPQSTPDIGARVEKAPTQTVPDALCSACC